MRVSFISRIKERPSDHTGPVWTKNKNDFGPAGPKWSEAQTNIHRKIQVVVNIDRVILWSVGQAVFSEIMSEEGRFRAHASSNWARA
jgi:hypothetical protein